TLALSVGFSSLGVDLVEAGNGLLVWARLVRRVKHIVNAMTAYVSDLERHGRSELLLDGQIPCVLSGQTNIERTSRHTHAIGQGVVATRRDRRERKARRALCQIKDRGKIRLCV